MVEVFPGKIHKAPFFYQKVKIFFWLLPENVCSWVTSFVSCLRSVIWETHTHPILSRAVRQKKKKKKKKNKKKKEKRKKKNNKKKKNERGILSNLHQVTT